MAEQGIGLGMSVASQIVGATQQAGQLRQAAAVDDANAQRTLFQGSLQEQQIDQRARAVQGEAIAAQGGSGLMMGTGSAFDLIYENAIERERAVLNTRFSAQSQADTLEVQAAQKRSAAKGALVSGLIGAGAKALAGVTSINSAAAVRGAQVKSWNPQIPGGYKMQIPFLSSGGSTYGNGALGTGQTYWNLP